MAKNTRADDVVFDDSPRGLAARWKMEMQAADKWLEKSRKRGKDVLKVYLDEREKRDSDAKKLALFYSDVQIKVSLLYGKVPKVDASRRFADPADDDARIGAEIFDRILNSDIEKGSDTYQQALMYALEDWQIPGLGIARLRYHAEFETVPEVPPELHPFTGDEIVPGIPAHEKKTYECVDTDYVHWEDFKYSPCRTWNEARWVAFRVPMTRDQLVETYGEDLGKAVPLNAKKIGYSDENATNDPTNRADVWEIWSKDDGRVYDWCDAYPTILRTRDDPYQLDNFFPCPKPLTYGTTTSGFRPVPWYYFAQDQYQGCNTLYQRLCLLKDAVRVTGAYDRDCPELAKMLDGDAENKLYPSTNWGKFSEKGGFKGAVDFLPLDMVVAAISILTQKLSEEIDLLRQITGMSDIMRGAAQQSATATEQQIKAKFAGIRSQKEQEEFARFASEIQALKAEMISKHFDPESIVAASNMDKTTPPDQLMRAIQLIKSEHYCYRIEVKPEQISMTDMASLKAEKTEFMQASSTYFQMLAQAPPDMVPALLELFQWAMAGFKGASTAEGILDGLVAQWKQKLEMQKQQPPPPDPKAMAAQAKLQGEQMKAQADMQKTQAELQADIARINAQAQADLQLQQAQSAYSVQEELEKAKIKAALSTPRIPGMP